MKILSIIFLSLLVVGCERMHPERSQNPSPAALPSIRKIVANQLKWSVDEIPPDATFGALGADDLDLVEIILTTEKELNILIDEDGLMRAAGATDPATLTGDLTVEEFAVFAEAAPHR